MDQVAQVAVKLHQLYSIHFSNTLDVIFEDISMVNISNLKDSITNLKSNTLTSFYIVDNKFLVNMLDNTITLTGYKINNTTWILPKDGRGDGFIITHTLSKESMLTAIEYLYHILSGL